MIRTWFSSILLALSSPAIAHTGNFDEKPNARRPRESLLPTASEGIEDREQWVKPDELTKVRNTTRPALLPVLPTQSPSGAATIVAPGGVLLGLAIDHEGWQVARWQVDRGVAAFVLKYRTECPSSEHLAQLAA